MTQEEELRAENERLRAELKSTKDQWERELVMAKANLVNLQDELATVKEKLRLALLRNISAEDDSFYVREEAAKIIAQRK